jgi:hypothetical protein
MACLAARWAQIIVVILGLLTGYARYGSTYQSNQVARGTCVYTKFSCSTKFSTQNSQLFLREKSIKNLKSKFSF